ADLAEEGVDGRSALEHARRRITFRAQIDERNDDLLGYTLDDVVVDPVLFAAVGLQEFGAIQDVAAPIPEIGESVSNQVAAAPAFGSSVCFRCCAEVHEEDCTFGVWHQDCWRFTGWTLPGAKLLFRLGGPLLCWSCAVRAKYGLIAVPAPALPSSNSNHESESDGV